MTRKACVIGWPIAHSRSPLIHGYWLRKYAIDGTYTKEAVTPDELDVFVGSLGDNGFAGCNVTVPHKVRVLDLVCTADAAARSIGAANTLWFEDGELHACNTDAYGFLANLDESAPGWDASGRRPLVLGAGGAARAIVYALMERGVAEIDLVNRTRARAEDLARHFGSSIQVDDWDSRDRRAGSAGLIVNTTTLGMAGAGTLDFNISAADPGAVVCDLVYSPLRTRLLEEANARGLRTVSGLGMLLHQAVPGFEKWFGVRPEVTDELRTLAIANLETSSC
jgi:shikimate dehydrogenase